MAKIKYILFVFLLAVTKPVAAQPWLVPSQGIPTIQVREKELGFRIPNLSEILTFAIRGFFIVAGLLALMY
ncbi:hypothetical protein HY357_00030, partial [Candidatus Roizmanbacteria bacterium]|nr:hypothetical protein [Candidatus Roizmanbacteria bacterium]